MFWKLITRNIHRHYKRDKLLALLICLCSSALIVLLTFITDFKNQYRDQVIGMQTGHIQILPVESPLLSETMFYLQSEETPLISISNNFDLWIRSLPQVEEASPLISRYAMAYSIDGDLESSLSLFAIKLQRISRLFPFVTGESCVPSSHTMNLASDVMMYRARVQYEYGELDSNTSCFSLNELSINKKQLDDFISVIASDFPSIFKSGKYVGEKKVDLFLEDWKKGMGSRLTKKDIPGMYFMQYNWELENAIEDSHDNQQEDMIVYYNKKIFSILYPRFIKKLTQPVYLGKRVTLRLPSFFAKGCMDLAKVIPACYCYMCETLPLYTPNSFIDIDHFQKYMNLDACSSTSYVIRLKDINSTEYIKNLISLKTIELGKRVKVVDYRYLGKMYMSIVSAINIVVITLVVLFTLIIVVFCTNLVCMTIMHRRKEIGTEIALGLNRPQALILFIGEMLLIITIAYAVGCITSYLIIALFHKYGVAGMVFFTGGRLKLTMQIMPYIQGYVFVSVPTIIIAFFAFFRLYHVEPINLLREF